jgi:hypothetical protein
MLGDTKKKIKVLNKLELSVEEFEFLYMIQLYKNDRNLVQTEFTVQFELYYEINKTKYNYKKFLDKYEKLGYIINTNNEKDEVIQFNKIQIQPKFAELFIIDVDECWKQVCEVYPAYIIINGNRIMAQTAKSNIKKVYFELVIKGGNKFLHEEFISLTEWFYEGQRVSSKEGLMGLEKWIMSWEQLKPILTESLLGKDVSSNQLNIFNGNW